VFSDGVGRIDMPGGNEQDMEASLDRIIKMEGIQKLLPGHGDVVLTNAKKVIQDILSG
jgi:glyoxylase-like metal-dependent hydrolase (beta-lactamase superfamily II)